MSSWYDNNPRNMINGRLAYDGAGAIGRGISSVGGAMSQYARLQYQKKRDKKGDENLADTNRTKIKTHQIDYAKSTDTAKINTKGAVHVANINKENDKYVIDKKTGIAKIDYARATDTAKINSKGAVQVANIHKSADVYKSNVSAENNKRTNRTKLTTSNITAKTQKYVSDKQYEGAKLKVQTKKKKLPKWKKDMLKSARTPQQIDNILKMKNDIGEENI